MFRRKHEYEIWMPSEIEDRQRPSKSPGPKSNTIFFFFGGGVDMDFVFLEDHISKIRRNITS